MASDTFGAELRHAIEADDLVAACLLADVPVTRRTRTPDGRHRVEVPMKHLATFARLLRDITDRHDARRRDGSGDGSGTGSGA